MIRFSQAFNLNKTQMELDFVDIPLDTDIKLFVDPYAISVRPESWFQECNEYIISFFNTLLDSIKNKNNAKIKYLLSNLKEPNETHLGHSYEESKGAGIGSIQGTDIYKALSKSKAVETGDLKDLSDCTLMVEGIGPDKISDITINVIRKLLVEYTKEQCDLYNIPTFKCSLKPYWCISREQWINDYYDLPIFDEKPTLLCPKLAVRRHILMDDKKFYESNILEYLQAEHLDARTSLVETLKKGVSRVTKKKLKEQEEYKKSKNYIYEFTNKHPEVLTKFKENKKNEALNSITNDDIEREQAEEIKTDILALQERLDTIIPGNEGASEYHNTCLSILNVVFNPDYLSLFKKEQEINEGRKRIDIIASNTDSKNFFYNFPIKNQLQIPFVIFECKNYTKDIKNPELDQIAGRLCDKRGRLGIILCRKIEDKDLILQKQKDYLSDERKYILVFDDPDLQFLLECRKNNNETEINKFLYLKIQELVL